MTLQVNSSLPTYMQRTMILQMLASVVGNFRSGTGSVWRSHLSLTAIQFNMFTIKSLSSDLNCLCVSNNSKTVWFYNSLLNTNCNA